jgi:hypothetical protein
VQVSVCLVVFEASDGRKAGAIVSCKYFYGFPMQTDVRHTEPSQLRAHLRTVSCFYSHAKISLNNFRMQNITATLNFGVIGKLAIVIFPFDVVK